MKRFRVHVGVENLETSIVCNCGLVGADPAVAKCSDAEWMLDGPPFEQGSWRIALAMTC